MSFWSLLGEVALFDLICKLFSPKRHPIGSRPDHTPFSSGNDSHYSDGFSSLSSGNNSPSGGYFGGYSDTWNDCIDDDIINDAFFDDF